MRSSSGLILALLVVLPGCNPATPTDPTTAPQPVNGSQNVLTTKVEEKDDHDHEREHMMVAHCGPSVHVWLTAHISSKSGNELDLFFENADDDKPRAVSVQKIVAKAKPSREDQTYELVFEPAPASERPKGEPADQCSHFVAKAPWMKPDDTLFVQFELELDGKLRKSTWKNFDVKANTHHNE